MYLASSGQRGRKREREALFERVGNKERARRVRKVKKLWRGREGGRKVVIV